MLAASKTLQFEHAQKIKLKMEALSHDFIDFNKDNLEYTDGDDSLSSFVLAAIYSF